MRISISQLRRAQFRRYGSLISRAQVVLFSPNKFGCSATRRQHRSGDGGVYGALERRGSQERSVPLHIWLSNPRSGYPVHCGFAIDHRRFGILDHPLEPVIGRRDAPTRWRMMTARNIAAKHSRGGEPSISSAICYSAAAPDPGYGPATSAAQGCAPAGRFVVTFQSDLGSPVLFGKIFLFSYPPNHIYNVSHPVPHRGAFRDRHGRRAWDAVDAAAFCARWDRRAGSLNP